MAGSVLNRPQTCLSCLRRLTNAVGSANANPISVSLLQSRGKRTGRPRDQGVVVRLLEDIPKWGRKDAVFRVERGRMRNLWYPNKRAEYMTTGRFHELGLSSADIGERDHMFGSFVNSPDENARLGNVDEGASASASMVQHVAPPRAHALLEALVPQCLTFYRKPIHPLPSPVKTDTPTPTQRSPLIAHHDMLAPSTEPDASDYDPAIFGSVSADMIVADIKSRLGNDAEASRVSLEPNHIRFLGLGGGADRLKALGRWEIEIALVPVPKFGQKATVEPIKRTVEILPEEGESAHHD
ncbi:hypothetical protein GQ53DRAFT_748185 [Thozetella sp. PMI_491]|nr:hypothetical protein GQ53DRAFT_748185 [Thozetella sp. PMI_491]